MEDIVVVVRPHMRYMITMRKATRAFLLVPLSMVLCLEALGLPQSSTINYSKEFAESVAKNEFWCLDKSNMQVLNNNSGIKGRSKKHKNS